ncbi:MULTISPECIES: hypothetical protein [unclassified Marinobacter]|uniref:hypothetical protein n=1 Tax=unclassified Marinobacter TaxID=83889 RepID=UPI000BF86A16|nr:MULTISPECIES: hypothetical protein [unclassified Marinobacter]PFG07996.1 hypothetical protein ATI45_0226 [Marinobacter sp. LV10MA510-1]PFG53815.1 hypothetical protein ATG98_2985 [Marinobacter sp. LV10R520-4]
MMTSRSEQKVSLTGDFVALLGLIFVVWTWVSVALPEQGKPVVTDVTLGGWQGTVESTEGTSSSGDAIPQPSIIGFPPLALNFHALHLLAFERPPARLLGYPGQSQAPPSLLPTFANAGFYLPVYWQVVSDKMILSKEETLG